MLNCNYVLIDGARIGTEIGFLKESYSKQGKSLYLGKSLQDLEDVGPFLFILKESDSLSKWFKEHAWGNSFGVLAFSHVGFEALHKHCRKFLLVQTEDHQELYFRFYDPRVLRIFLPTCTWPQLREFFGPIEYFILEDEDPDYLIKYQLNRELLITNRYKLSEVLEGKADLSNVNSQEYVSGVSTIKERERKISFNQESNSEPASKEQGSPNSKKSSSKSNNKWNDFFFE